MKLHSIPSGLFGDTSDDVKQSSHGEIDDKANNSNDEDNYSDNSWGDNSDSNTEKPKINLAMLLPPSSSDDDHDQRNHETPISTDRSTPSGPPKPPRMDSSNVSLHSLSDNHPSGVRSPELKKDIIASLTGNSDLKVDGVEGKIIIERKESSSGSWNNQTDSVSLKMFNDKMHLEVIDVKEESCISSISSAHHMQDISACNKSYDIIGKGSFDQELESLEFHPSNGDVATSLGEDEFLKTEKDNSKLNAQGNVSDMFAKDKLDDIQYHSSLEVSCSACSEDILPSETNKTGVVDNVSAKDKNNLNEKISNTDLRSKNKCVEEKISQDESNSTEIEFSDTESKENISITSEILENEKLELANTSTDGNFHDGKLNVNYDNSVSENLSDDSETANRGTLGRRDTLQEVEEVWEANARISREEYDDDNGNSDNNSDFDDTNSNEDIDSPDNIHRSGFPFETVSPIKNESFDDQVAVPELLLDREINVGSDEIFPSTIETLESSSNNENDCSLGFRTSSSNSTPPNKLSPRLLGLSPILNLDNQTNLEEEQIENKVLIDSKTDKSDIAGEKNLDVNYTPEKSNSSILKEDVGEKEFLAPSKKPVTKVSRNNSITIGDLFTENRIRRRCSLMPVDRISTEIKSKYKRCRTNSISEVEQNNRDEKVSFDESGLSFIINCPESFKMDESVDHASLGDGLSISTDDEGSYNLFLDKSRDLAVPLAQLEDSHILPDDIQLLIRETRLRLCMEKASRETTKTNLQLLRQNNIQLEHQIQELEEKCSFQEQKNMNLETTKELVQFQKNCQTEDVVRSKALIGKLKEMFDNVQSKCKDSSIEGLQQTIKIEDLMKQLQSLSMINAGLKRTTKSAGEHS